MDRKLLLLLCCCLVLLLDDHHPNVDPPPAADPQAHVDDVVVLLHVVAVLPALVADVHLAQDVAAHHFVVAVAVVARAVVAVEGVVGLHHAREVAALPDAGGIQHHQVVVTVTKYCSPRS